MSTEGLLFQLPLYSWHALRFDALTFGVLATFDAGKRKRR